MQMNVEKKDVFGFIHDYRAMSKRHLCLKIKFATKDIF